MRRVGRALAVLATLAGSAGGAPAHAAPLGPFARADATTFTVTSTSDPGDGVCDADCTLREAIAASNATAGTDANTINFDVGTAATITIGSALPAITRPVTIIGPAPANETDPRPVEITTSAHVDRLLDFEAGAGSAVDYLSLHGDAATGVYVDGTAQSVNVFGCFIGTARNGTSPSHDLATGVELRTDSNIVQQSVIANSFDAVRIDGGTQNQVYGNTIGLDALGNTSYAGSAGVRIGAGSAAQVVFNTIGNVSIAVFVTGQLDTVTGASVGSNTIGLNRIGQARPNDIGIRLVGDVRNSFVSQNSVLASRQNGIELLPGVTTATVQSNTVGGDGDRATGADGIYIDAATSTHVYNNIVRRSGRAGIRTPAGLATQISGNQLQDNGGLGIDVGADGPNPNDTPDADGVQNYPVVTANGAGEVTFTIDGKPNENYTLEAYSSPACDPSGYGEGETPVLISNVFTDSSGHVSYTAPAGSLGSTDNLTATATRIAGDSSEFSPCLGVVPVTVTPTPTPTPTPTAPPAATVVPTPLATATPTPVPPPVAGQSVDVAPVNGTVLVRRKGSKVATPLKAGEQIPLGSLVDATDGRVRLTSAAGRGATQTADFYGGAFTIAQAAGLVTELRLAVPKNACAPAHASAAVVAKPPKKKKRSKKTVAEVWGDGKGAFRTRGSYGSAAIRGTKWLTRERCDGTFFQTATGVVAVRDFARHKTVVLRAPHTYVAKAR